MEIGRWKIHIKTLEKITFLGVVLLLPTQLGKHFWPSFSFVEGIRIDYLSPTLYLTDILTLLLFAIYSLSRILASRGKIPNFKLLISNKPPITLFLAVLIVGIIQSQSPMAGFYKLLKVFEFAFFGFYIVTTVNWKRDYQTILALLAVGVFFESLLAAWQFARQSSIGGIFWFFGERTFSGQTPGIANAILDGKLVLRPYGTFPHPNVLAGYLTIVLAMVISSASWRIQISNFKKGFFLSTLVIGTSTLLLTLSRVAIILWFVVLGLWLITYLKRKWQVVNDKWKIYLLVVLVLIGSIGIVFLTPLSSRFASLLTIDNESVLRRHELNVAAIEMFKTSPFFGIGLNNFLVRLPEYQKPTPGPLWLQPVHNIYLLILAETGIVGFIFFLWFVGKTFVRLHSSLIILSITLVLSFFDHYFLTLQQGQLLLAFVLGLAWSKHDA